MKKILAVLTEEIKYAERLCSYCNRKRNLVYTAVPFDNAEKCRDFGRNNRIELLLADRKLLEQKHGDGMNEHTLLSDIGAARIIGLDTGYALNNEYAFNRGFAEDSNVTGGMAYTFVSKYQPAEELMREVIQNCEGMELLRTASSVGRPVRIIGVYSPISRCGKSSFALTLSRMLARKQKTLYLSFEEFSAFPMLTGQEHRTSLSDAIYHMKQGTLNSPRLYSMIFNYSGIDYIPPMRYADDRTAVTGSDYVRLINEILRNSLYDAVVVDMDSFADEASDVMELCSVVYMPVIDDTANRMKLNAFSEYLEKSDRAYLSEKIVRIQTPKPEGNAWGSSYIDSMLYGSMGDLVRALGEV